MRILIVNRYMGLYGGAETVIKELGCHLNRLGAANRIVTLNISDEVEKICGSLDIVTPKEKFPYKFRSSGFWSSVGVVNEIKVLRQLVKKHAGEFDVINAHNFPANWVCGGLGKPVVWMCNEVPDFYNNPQQSLAIRLLRRAGIGLDAYIVNKDVGAICVADEFNAGNVARRYQRTPEIIHYGIEYDFFSRDEGKDEVLQKYGLTKNFVLLQVGMLSPEKNQLKSIEALEALKKDIPNAKLVLAGRPQHPYDKMLKHYVEEKRVQADVIFTGHIAKSLVRSFYHACHVALFPVKSQGGWLSPFEALCAGKPIVVSSTMGAASIIKKENIGVVSDDLLRTVKDVADKYDFYLSAAGKGREWVRENLNWEVYSRKMLAVFKKCLE